jgi:hypothetical protein
MLQGGYLEVNRGSANRTGWNSIIWSFMISKSTNNVRIMEKVVSCDDATNMHGRGKYRNFGRKYSKENLHSQDIFSDRTQKQYTA